MPSSYTTSLRLTLPATGELAGQWGNTVNTGITELLDSAVAGTASISTWGGAGVAYTLSNNSGAADEARKMFIVASGSPGEAKNVICPAVSKFYVFRNDTTGGFALTLKTSGGTGIAVPAGQYKFLYCDGTNVVEMFNSAGALTLSGALTVGGTATFAANPTFSAGTANQVQYLNGSKVLSGSANLTFDGTALTLGGNPTLSAGTANGVTYLNGSKVLTSGSVLTFDGTVLGTTTLDATNVEVTNIKAKDGTASASIADTTGVMSLVANPVFSGGTANGVLYLNGSKVATSGSALTYNGTAFSASASGAISGIFNRDTSSGATLQIQVVGNNVGTLGSDTGGNGRFDLAAATSMQLRATGAGSFMSFDANNAEQMRLTSTGLGIGTSSPKIQEWRAGTYLTVANASTRGQVEIDSAVADSGSASLGALIFTYSTNTTNHKDVALIEATSSGATANQRGGALNFYTKANGTASPALNMTLDSSGNLGLGVTPSAWGSGTRGFNIGSGSAIWNPGSGNQTHILTNAYNDGTNYIYRNSSNASRYSMVGDAHQWHIAPSGTAGNTISFTQAMTLDASGNLLVGTTTANAKVKLALTSPGTLGTVVNVGSFGSSGVLSLGGATNNTDGVYLGTGDTGGTGVASGIGFLRGATGWNSALAFYTNNVTSGPNGVSAITERVRITSDGDLGVGTTSPIALGAGYTSVTVNGSTSGRFDVLFNGTHYGAFLADSGGAKVLAQGASNPLVLGTNNTERARITSGGDLLVGKTSTADTVVGFGVGSGGTCSSTNGASANTTVTYAAYSTGAAAYRFYVGFGGTVYATNTTITAISDQRLKENIRDLDVGLDKIMALKPRKFDWKAGKGKDIKGDRGWIAQEFEQVFPDLIDEWKDPAPEGEEPYKAVRADLIPVLVKAIQEQQALITALTARVAALEAKP